MVIILYHFFIGHGRCGVAVIRVSGSHSENALKQLTKFSEIPTPRTAILRTIQDPFTAEVIDKGLVLWFPGKQAFSYKYLQVITLI